MFLRNRDKDAKSGPSLHSDNLLPNSFVLDKCTCVRNFLYHVRVIHVTEQIAIKRNFSDDFFYGATDSFLAWDIINLHTIFMIMEKRKTASLNAKLTI